MKKSLLALAVLGAFAGAASAQSSVTVFGVVDLSINYIDNSNNAGAGGANTGDKMWGLASNQLASNRLGFRGVEDLGGGLGAGFWIEMGMNNATGQAGGGSGGLSNSDATSSQLWNRRSTLSLTGKWGELRMGRDYVPSFWQTVFFDVDGANGLGNGLNILDGSLGSGATTFARANNSIAYHLPSGIGGLYGTLMYAFGQSSGAVSGNQYQGGRVGWAAGPIDVALGWGQTEKGATGVGSNSKFEVWNIGGSWDFKIAKLYAYYNENKWDTAKQSLWELSVGVPIGAGEFRGTYASSDRQGTDPNTKASIEANDATIWSLEYVYNLSKRTAVYTTYGQISNDGKAAFSLVGGHPFSSAGGSSKGYNFGIRHAF